MEEDQLLSDNEEEESIDVRATKKTTAEKQWKRQKRKANEDRLGIKRKEMDRAKVWFLSCP